MKREKIRLITTTLLVFVLFCKLTAQSRQNFSFNEYNVFDKVLGVEHSELYQGQIYTQQYKSEKGKSKFYKSFDFDKGAVWYNGQAYFDKMLKYDLQKDDLLLNMEYNGVSQGVLRVVKRNVDSFLLFQKKFVNIKPKQLKANEIEPGFYEVLYQTKDLELYVKRRKVIKKDIEQSTLKIEFTEKKRLFVIYYKNAFYLIDSKKSLLKLFSESKRDIMKKYNYGQHRDPSKKEGLFTRMIKEIHNAG